MPLDPSAPLCPLRMPQGMNKNVWHGSEMPEQISELHQMRSYTSKRQLAEVWETDASVLAKIACALVHESQRAEGSRSEL